MQAPPPPAEPADDVRSATQPLFVAALQAEAAQRWDEAATWYRAVIAVDATDFDAHYNLGNVLESVGAWPAAEAAYRNALCLRPGAADAWCNLGIAQQTQRRLLEAELSFHQALAQQPAHAAALNNLAALLQQKGELEFAHALYQRALAAAPDSAHAHENLLFTLNYHPHEPAEAIYAAYEDYDRRHGSEIHRSNWRRHDNSRSVGRVLRVGYVSPDFRAHACMYFLEPLLARHDRQRFEIHAYAQLAGEDAVTQRYKRLVHHWVPTAGLSDDALAQRIRDDGIDILVDVAGHTAGNRLGVFARKPAPVSLSWLGYGYTTGLKAIDYLLTDETCAPPGSEHLFAETPWRLPGTCFVYRPPEVGPPEVGPLPANRNGYVTFGTLSRAIRINDRVVQVWSEILRRVPTARLVVDSSSYQDVGVQQALIRRFEHHGIASSRLSVGLHSPGWGVLQGIDIGLDCFPHNSGTTLFESLYMGVPYVTLAGRPSVGRLGSTILNAVGLHDLVTTSPEAYVERAVAWAGDLQALAGLRAGLRERMKRSALMDEVGFARTVEQAYVQMFAAWAQPSDPPQRDPVGALAAPHGASGTP